MKPLRQERMILIRLRLIMRRTYRYSNRQSLYQLSHQSICVTEHANSKFDRGQTREICEKQEKYFKGKVVTFTVQKSSKYLKMGKFGFVAPHLSKQLGAQCGAFKSKETRFFCGRNEIHLHSTAIIYPCYCFNFNVNEI